MNNKALTLSLVMAILAVFFVSSYVTSVEDEQKRKFGASVLVVVAKKDIREMDTLNETMLEFKSVPKRFLEPAAFSFEKTADDKDEDAFKRKTDFGLKSLAGAIAVVPIKKGEQITYNKLTEPSMRTGLAPQVMPGKRAISMPVGEITGVSKLVKPGDRVDVIGIIDMGSGKANRLAKTLLQDVEVLATGRNVTNNVARTVETDAFSGKEKIRSLAEDPNFSSVTLEVDPPQAEMLTLLVANGAQLTLSLRNNDDSDRVPLAGMTLMDLLGTDAGKVRAPSSQR